MPRYKPAKPGLPELARMHAGTKVVLDDTNGGEWPLDQFTMRRLRDGDIVEIEAAPAAANQSTAPDPAPAPAPAIQPATQPATAAPARTAAVKPPRER